MIDPIKVDTGKFTTAVKADEIKASTWVGRHPGWTLALIGAQWLVIAFLALRAYG